jgi:hypothetical protein
VLPVPPPILIWMVGARSASLTATAITLILQGIGAFH